MDLQEDKVEKWSQVILLEEAHWLKPPTLARHHSNYLHGVVLPQEVLVRNMELISLHQPKSLVKVKMRHHMSNHVPESFSLASILAEQGVHHQEGVWVRMIG